MLDVSALSRFLSTSKGYMMNNATQAVVDGRMEPITKTEPTQQKVLTGQYLHDTFLKPTEGDLTRMAVIRAWAEQPETYDVVTIGNASDAMVKHAANLDADAWTGEKNDKGVPVGPDGKKVRGAKEQSAMNVRGIIQLAYGALRFARIELADVGYDENTGYIAMRALAKTALDKKGITWTGEAKKTDADKEAARLKRETKEETKALVQVQQDNPRMVGESLADWNTRVFALAESQMDAARQEADEKAVADLLAKLEEKHDAGRLVALAMAIFDKHGIAYKSEEEQTEPSEQEVLDAMANVSESEAAH